MKFRSVWLNLLQVHLCGKEPQETQAPDCLKRRLSKQPHILIQKIKSLVEGKKIKFIQIIKAVWGLEITLFSLSPHFNGKLWLLSMHSAKTVHSHWHICWIWGWFLSLMIVPQFLTGILVTGLYCKRIPCFQLGCSFFPYPACHLPLPSWQQDSCLLHTAELCSSLLQLQLCAVNSYTSIKPLRLTSIKPLRLRNWVCLALPGVTLQFNL